MRDDCVIDYKNQNMGLALDAVFPNGIDLYFYNVGGPLVDNVLGRFRRRARVVTCGSISEYLIETKQKHRFVNL